MIIEFEIEAADIYHTKVPYISGVRTSEKIKFIQSCRTFSINGMYEDVESLVKEDLRELGISQKRFMDSPQGVPISSIVSTPSGWLYKVLYMGAYRAYEGYPYNVLHFPMYP